MSSIHPEKFKEIHQKEDNTAIIDVRSPEEHRQSRIPRSILIPLDQLEARAGEIPKGEPIVVYCHSGNRSRQAMECLKGLGFENVLTLEGGIEAFQKSGGSVEGKLPSLPLRQQVFLTAGLIVLTGTLLSWLIGPVFLWVTGLAGTGLLISGLTGFCGMERLLARMPWNKG